MSELTTLYGCIKGAFGSTKNFNNLYHRNKVIVNALPETDKWPPLTKGLFLVPIEYTKPGFYQIQMIHFGASFNNFSGVWEQWLEKFENLLRALYWFEVNLHLEIEMIGRYDYFWQAGIEDTQNFHLELPHPVSCWSFTGGPRQFEV